MERNVKIHHVKGLFGASFLMGRDLCLLQHPGANVWLGPGDAVEGGQLWGGHTHCSCPNIAPRDTGIGRPGAGAEHHPGTSAPWWLPSWHGWILSCLRWITWALGQVCNISSHACYIERCLHVYVIYIHTDACTEIKFIRNGQRIYY